MTPEVQGTHPPDCSPGSRRPRAAELYPSSEERELHEKPVDPAALVDRVKEIASGHTVDEVEQLEIVEPLPANTPSGYVDLLFYEGRLERIQDARGLEIEIGNWLDVGQHRALRITWPPSRLAEPDLPDPTANLPGAAHAHGRETERAMAYLAIPRSGTTRAKVLACFEADWRNGGDGLIDEDVAARTDLKLYTAAPRRKELVDMGWLRPSGRYGRTDTDSPSIMWELTPEAHSKMGHRRA